MKLMTASRPRGIFFAGVFFSLLLCLPADSQAPGIVFDRMDKNHSTIGFLVPIFGGFSEVEGKFTDFSVVIHYEPDPSKASVEAVIQATSIDTGIDDRDQDLRSPKFFDVAKYPEIRFKSSRIEKRGNGYVASGTLQMHGVSREIVMPFQVHGPTDHDAQGLVLGISSEITLDRDDYGITWRHPSETFVGDQVQVRIRLITKLTKPTPQQ